MFTFDDEKFQFSASFHLVSSCVWWALVLSRTKGGYLFRAHVGGTAIVSHPHSSLEKSPENDDDTTCEWNRLIVIRSVV